MRITTAILSALAVVTMAACGSNEGAPSDTGETPAAVKKSKFKGAKYAPPQDVMNRTAAAELWQREGRTLVTPGEACKSVRWLDQMTPACKIEYDAVLEKSVFTPRECRKGDEREGYDSVLLNPVSCHGDIDTPHLSAKVMMVFHDTDGETKAWYGGMVSGTMVKH